MNKKQYLLSVFAILMMFSCAPKHYHVTSVERSRIIIDSRYDQHPDEKAIICMPRVLRVICRTSYPTF